MSDHAEAPSIILVGQQGCLAGRSVQATGPVVVLGRETDCQVKVDDIDASRHHARIQFADAQWSIEDLSSANGTFVNGQRLSQPQVLRPSDIIRIGACEFQFQPFSISSAPTHVPPEPQVPPAGVPPSSPAAPQPVAPQAAYPQAAAPQPVAPQAAYPQAAAPQPVAPQAAYPQSAAPQPVAPQAAYPQAAAPQPVAPQAAYPQAAAPQPVAPQAAYPQSAAPQPVAPQAAYPQSAYPQPVAPQAAYPQSAYQPAPYAQQQFPQPMPAYAQPAAPRSGRTALVVVLICSIVLVCLGGVAAVLYFTGVFDKNPGTHPSPPGVTGQGSVTVASAQSGYVTGPGGASISVPSGAVPAMEDGAVGSMTFSIEESDSRAVSLPSGFASHGPVYELGPEGFNFNSPVEIRLPIPEGVDPAGVLGLTYLDTATDTWVMVPGTVDSVARTVSVTTTHFSLWSVFGPGTGSTSPNQWLAGHGGWFRVNNGHVYKTGQFPRARRLPTTVTYGICIASYALDNPADGSSIVAPYEWTMTVSDYHPYSPDAMSGASNKWWFPVGTYNLVEVRFVSEINNDPLYLPAFSQSFRPIGAYRIEANQVLAFPNSAPQDVPPGSAPAWQDGRPACFGLKDTSVGHGDVQVTLTWQKGIDLDLHVFDPNGEEVSYSMPTSSSGGQLDRDNKCTDMVIGRPENIFWPGSGAPSGKYRVLVDYFGPCRETGAVAFVVRTIVKGVVRTHSGTIASGTQEVTSFTLP